MAEYIEKQALRDKLYETDAITLKGVKIINQFPPADVRTVVRGKWINTDAFDKESNVKCSECETEFDYIDGVCYLCAGHRLPNFCPNCGADMRGYECE